MRSQAFVVALALAPVVVGAEVESRVLTHYLPQDFLETAVRSEKWTEVPLAVAGGLRKGDTVRIWSGGLIDRGNGEQPGANANGPAGVEAGKAAVDKTQLVLSPEPADAFALLFRTEAGKPQKCMAPGKPLEIKVSKDNEKVLVGFNDERGRYADNHLGRGRRHEFDPLWVRIEVVRTIVD
jgi:hypothetical protein